MVRARRPRGDQSRARSRTRVRHGIASDDPAVPSLARARIARRRIGARLRMRIRDPRDRRLPVWAPAGSSARTSIRRRSSRAAPMRSATASIAAFVPVEGLPADVAAVRCRRRQHPRQSDHLARAGARATSCGAADASCCRAFSMRRPMPSSTLYRRWFNIARLRKRGRLGRACGNAQRKCRLNGDGPRPARFADPRLPSPRIPRCPEKNTPAVPVARPCSGSCRNNSRCARDRSAAGSARRCSTGSRSRSRSRRRSAPMSRRARRRSARRR